MGVDVPPEVFVKTALEKNCQIICCSALLTTTLDAMAEVVTAVEAAGIRNKVKIMVGGAPVTEAFCRQIGADCYAPDAVSAADAAVWKVLTSAYIIPVQTAVFTATQMTVMKRQSTVTSAIIHRHRSCMVRYHPMR